MTSRRRVAIVGGSVAGLTVAESLRRSGFDSGISLIAAESELPYDRPPLSKQVLDGRWEPEKVRLRQPGELDALELDLSLGDKAVRVDDAARRVHLESGGVVPYDILVVATGVVPRRLAAGHELAGVHLLRTLDDAVRLRADLLHGGPLVVIGAGPLGTEVAAAGRKMGLEVTLVDPSPFPMLRQVGTAVSKRISALHAERGVTLELGVSVDRLVGWSGRVSGVRLSDGRTLAAATVLVGIGSDPATDWLNGSSIPIGNGVMCDEYCRAAENTYAVGDVAEWLNPRFRARMRIEHRMNATEQAAVVAKNIMGADEVFDPIPYFWTDQYETKIQGYGLTGAEGAVEIEELDGTSSRFAVRYTQNGLVQGILGWNAARWVRDLRREVGRSVDDDSERQAVNA
ncbi:NAD(P)/FAD-dependent oxidoreductase [Nocardia salmonicida]|uniref:NAD(P)/FAD-dependent oxidoreductase n=1 Tax=Nocardia salmonicida TaxID=53431 RepID=UPI0036730C95